MRLQRGREYPRKGRDSKARTERSKAPIPNGREKNYLEQSNPSDRRDKSHTRTAIPYGSEKNYFDLKPDTNCTCACKRDKRTKKRGERTKRQKNRSWEDERDKSHREEDHPREKNLRREE